MKEKITNFGFTKRLLPLLVMGGGIRGLHPLNAKTGAALQHFTSKLILFNPHQS